MKGEAYSFSTSPLCQISVCNSSRCLSVSSCQEDITSASVAEYHSSDQLGFKMLLSSTEHPPPPSETSPPPQTSPLTEDQQGREEARSGEKETASPPSTTRTTLWWRNGTVLPGRSSPLKQKEGVRKQTQEEGEVVEEEPNCWGSTFYSPKRG